MDLFVESVDGLLVCSISGLKSDSVRAMYSLGFILNSLTLIIPFCSGHPDKIPSTDTLKGVGMHFKALVDLGIIKSYSSSQATSSEVRRGFVILKSD